jgi:hypothetical protein
MKKLILSAAVILFATAACVAQKENSFKFSVGAELLFPTGALSNSQSFGIGGTGMIEIPLQDKLQGVAYSGILLFKGKSAGNGYNNPGLTIIPLRVGVKYFLTGSVYGGLQAGIGFFSGYGTGSAFSYSPQIGYEFKTNSGKSIDAAFKYDAYSKSGGTLSAIGFRLAYIF